MSGSVILFSVQNEHVSFLEAMTDGVNGSEYWINLQSFRGSFFWIDFWTNQS